MKNTFQVELKRRYKSIHPTLIRQGILIYNIPVFQILCPTRVQN